MKYNSIKGFRDIFGKDAEVFTFIEKKSENIFKKYDYQEIRIPTVEVSELFIRSIGENTDIVEKEMYVFEDKGKRRVALRPEGTAGVVRSYIENNLSQKFPSQKFFYIGQMFRQERPQAGRYREFLQVGCEYFNNPSVYADIEIILLAKEIIDSIGITGAKIEINSLGCERCRKNLVVAIKDILNNKVDEFCDDCKRRSEKNPLRALDCKIDGHKFKDVKIELCENCSQRFAKLKAGLESCGVNFSVSNKLVRGLDYYTDMVFEITSDVLGSQNAVCAGGRYDNLVHEMGGAQTPAIGFALGIDRLAEIITSTSHNKVGSQAADIFVIAFGKDETLNCGMDILKRLRNENIFSEGGYFNKSLKSQMRLADALNSKYVLIIGDDEAKKENVILRNMSDKSQKEISINNIIEEVKNVTSRATESNL
ncbi:MAG TPA: histidine--tRNA ligase [Elusimicrobia bacterium]|nr:MAG: histidine--tRNA ligase [Elusimicrobia bacterium RIFOXYD2_FULL_34_30]HAM38430.1 histidine--tRNA ligase [Elusimicrobiota bacterium]